MYDGTNPLAPEIKTVFPNKRSQGRSEETIRRKSSSMTGCLVVSRRFPQKGYHISARAGLGETVPTPWSSVVSSVFFADFMRTVSNLTTEPLQFPGSSHASPVFMASNTPPINGT
jgi:hypothetical protein